MTVHSDASLQRLVDEYLSEQSAFKEGRWLCTHMTDYKDDESSTSVTHYKD